MLRSGAGPVAKRLLHMTGTIRSATPQEWDAIRRLISDAALPTDDLIESGYSCFKVYADGSQIRGVVALEPLADQCAMLRSLVVSPDARGKGIGHALVESAETQARSQKIAAIYLLTTTADRFFSKLGYQRLNRETAPESVRVHEQFGRLCPASAVLMNKRIQG
jgi:amino-acid N-acetyltransferase